MLSVDHHEDESGDEHTREVTILYATETGNAQDVAQRLARVCRRLHFRVQVASLDEYAAESLFSAHLVLFVVSTTGSGREPRSMTAFWSSLLRSDLPEDLFDHMDFAVFGLGDTAYEKFCWVAKLLERRLLSLGATRLIARGEADDQHQLGIEGALDPWIAELTLELLRLFPLPPGYEILPETVPSPRVSIVEGPDISSLSLKDTNVGDAYVTATLGKNKRITAQDWYQDVRHLEFNFDRDVKYSPGDIAVIYPEVPKAEVESFLANTGWDMIADEPFSYIHVLEEQSLPSRLPRTLSLRLLFSKYLDINAVPRRSFFALLRHFTTDTMETEKLDEFLTGPEAADDLYDYCHSVRRTIREVLEEFRSAKIPKEYLFDLFPPLRPREFSIASSVHCHPRQIQLCVAIVSYKTKLRIPRRGVATTYLASLQPGAKLDIHIKKGFFTLPKGTNTPVICIGPGTGVAPARAIIEERVYLGAYNNTLYQGCRSSSKDQHYRDEFSTFADTLQENGDGHAVPARPSDLNYETRARTKLTYRVACSRDGPPGMKRTYVQDLILQDAKRIWELVVNEKAWIYISGSSNKMPAAVRAAIATAVERYGGKTEAEAKEYVAALEREGRLVEDCWA